MKRRLYVTLIIILGILFAPIVKAQNACKPAAMEEIWYAQNDDTTVANKPYCTGDQIYRSRGCMPTSYSMLVANLSDSSVTAETIRNDICSNSQLTASIRGALDATTLMNEVVPAAKEMNAKYHLSFRQLSRSEITVENIKNILRQPNKMLIASINCGRSLTYGKYYGNVDGCLFTQSANGHYIALSNVTDEGQIVVLNPSGFADSSTTPGVTYVTTKNSYSDDMIQRHIVNHINRGMWEATYTGDNCNVTGTEKGVYTYNGINYTVDGTAIGAAGTTSSSSSSSSSSQKLADGSKDDKYSDLSATFTIDGSGDTTTCETLLLNSDGEKNALGQFFDIIFIIIRVSAPTLTIILSVIDYIKVVLSGKSEEEAKKINKKTMIRIVIGVIILLLPSILELVFKIFGLYDLTTCSLGG